MLQFFRGVWNSANFTMTSAISPVFITLLGNAICLLQQGDRLYVDRAELALKLSRVFLSRLFKV